MAFPESVAMSVLDIVNWGVTIITIMAIWEFIAFATGYGTDKGPSASMRGATKLGGKISKWTEEKLDNMGPELKEDKRVKRTAGREKTALLNLYVEEKLEGKLLETLWKSLGSFKSVVDKGAKAGLDPKSDFDNAWNDVQKKAKAADGEIRKLNRRTFREDRRLKQLLEALEDKPVDKNQLTAARGFEGIILTEHEQVMDSMKVVMDALSSSGEIGKIAEFVTKSKKKLLRPMDALTKGMDVQTGLNEITAKWSIVGNGVNVAMQSQGRAYKAVDAIVAEFRKLWE